MFAFIDESSFPRPNEDSEHSVLLTACIKLDDIRNITRQVYQLKLDVFGGGNEVEIKAKNFIVPRTLRPERTRNREFVDRLFNIIESENIKVYAIVMEKPDYEPYVHPEKLAAHYTYLLQRINACAETANRAVSVIFDGQDAGSDEIISKKFYNLVYGVQNFYQIIEMPLFVSSKIVPGIQIADIMAGVTRHYYNRHLHTNEPNDHFDNWIKEKFTIIQSKTSRHWINGLYAYGIYLVRKNNLPRPPQTKE